VAERAADLVRFGDLLGNTDARLRPFWHPVARADGPLPVEVDLLGDRVATAGLAAADHLGLWWLAPDAPLAPLPVVAEDADERFVRVPSPPRPWRADAGRMADNFLDLGHLPFVHATSFADPTELEVPPLAVDRTATGFRVVHDHATRRLHGPGLGRRRMVLDYTAPFAVVLRLEYLDDDAVITTAFLHQPVADGLTVLWAINWRDDIVDGRCTPEETTAFQELVGAEDRAMLERVEPCALPLDPPAEVHTRADAPTLAMRRVLAGLLSPA
jgi:phenylpropionate dioxygenase-like ring-hydroxylating dioxygenase large terminal subunit